MLNNEQKCILEKVEETKCGFMSVLSQSVCKENDLSVKYSFYPPWSYNCPLPLI